MNNNRANEIVERCIARASQPLNKRRSVLHAVAGDMTHPYHPKVFYAHKKVAMATDFASAGISILPTLFNGHGPIGWGAERFNHLQTMQHWTMADWRNSYGVQIYTGEPSGYWLDLDFEKASVDVHPDAVVMCLKKLMVLTRRPLVTITKSGGLRFSCRVLNYVHPNDKESQEYVCEYQPSLDLYNNPIRKHLFMEVFGDRGVSRWDSRYEIVEGTIFDPPVVDKDMLFKIVDAYKRKVHVDPPEPPKSRTVFSQPPSSQHKKGVVTAEQKAAYADVLMDLKMHPEKWLKKKGGGLKSKRQNYLCRLTKHKKGDTYAVQFYMKPNGQIDIWCHDCRKFAVLSIPQRGEHEYLQEVIENAPAHEPIPTKAQQRQWKIDRIRSGKESPLALRRPEPFVFSGDTLDDLGDYTDNQRLIRNAFDVDKRIVLIQAETGAGKNQMLESFIQDGGKISQTAPTKTLALEMEKRMDDNQITSYFWRSRLWNWDLQKERSEHELVLEPFLNDAMCIDAERCETLFSKGGNPRAAICPNCVVFDICKTKGYLSQLSEMHVVDAQITAMPHIFTDPNSQGFAKILLKPVEVPVKEDGDVVWKKFNRVGVTDEAKAHEFYRYCGLLKSQLQTWRDMWHKSPLGRFSITMLGLLEAEKFDVAKVRSYVTDIHEAVVEQIRDEMQKVLIEGEIEHQDTRDKRTGQLLSRMRMNFKPKGMAYIPLDWDAYNTLWEEKSLPALPPAIYSSIDWVDISLEQAIRFGVYDIETTEDINRLPVVARSKTPLDQLIHAFDVYPHDHNIPMDYTDNELRWFVPPVLHPNLKKFVAMSATLNMEHAKRAFSQYKDDIAVVITKPTPLVEGARIFQNRSGVYPRSSLIDYENGEAVGMKYRCKQFFGFIENELKINKYGHAVITFLDICRWLEEDWMDTYEALKFFGHFDRMEGLDKMFDDVDILWIVGCPELRLEVIQKRSKRLYGSDAEPLRWERNDERVFVDPRVQSVYEASVVAKLEQAVGRARLNRHPKKVVVFSNIVIPSVSNRKETLWFDFEDCEVAGEFDDLEQAIIDRETWESEKSEGYTDVYTLFMEGVGRTEIQNKGYSEYLVRKVYEENRIAIQAENRCSREGLRVEVRRLRDAGNSLNAISKELDINFRLVKKLLEEEKDRL